MEERFFFSSYFCESQGLRRGRAVGDWEQRRERMGLRRQSPRLPLCPLRRRRQPQLPRHLPRRQGPLPLLFLQPSFSSSILLL